MASARFVVDPGAQPPFRQLTINLSQGGAWN
jgi:hypothetical protein